MLIQRNGYIIVSGVCAVKGSTLGECLVLVLQHRNQELYFLCLLPVSTKQKLFTNLLYIVFVCNIV